MRGRGGGGGGGGVMTKKTKKSEKKWKIRPRQSIDFKFIKLNVNHEMQQRRASK